MAIEGKWKPSKQEKPLEILLAEAVEQREAILDTLTSSGLLSSRPETNLVYSELAATTCLVGKLPQVLA